MPFHAGAAGQALTAIGGLDDERALQGSPPGVYRPLVRVLLLPVYLFPLLLQGSQELKSLYCVALTLLLLLSPEFPSMAAAFLPLLLAPILGLEEAQTLVPHYLDGGVLTLVCAQCLVGVLESGTSLVARFSCALLGVLGLRLLGMGFVAASLVAGTVLPSSHLALLLSVRLVERVVGDLEAEALDAQRRGDGWFDYMPGAPRVSRAMSTDDLFAQLASTVVSLPPKRPQGPRRRQSRFHAHQDSSPEEGSLLSAQMATRRRSSLGRRRMSRMMSFSGAAEARRKSRAKSICLTKLQPHEAALLAQERPLHRPSFARRMTASDAASEKLMGRQRHSLAPAAPSRRTSQAVFRSKPTLRLEAVVGAPLESGKQEPMPAPQPCLRSQSTFVPVKTPDPMRETMKKQVPLSAEGPQLRRESQFRRDSQFQRDTQGWLQKLQPAAPADERPSQPAPAPASPKSVLKDPKRKLQAGKKTMLEEPPQLSGTKQSAPSVAAAGPSSSGLKRRYSVAPPRSSSPSSSGIDGSGSPTSVILKKPRVNRTSTANTEPAPAAQMDLTEKHEPPRTPPATTKKGSPPREATFGELVKHMDLDVPVGDRDFLTKPSILKPSRITVRKGLVTPESDDGLTKNTTRPHRRAVDLDAPSAASAASDVRTPEPEIARARVISIAPQVQLVQWERTGTSGATTGDSHTSILTLEDEEEVDKVRGTFRRLKNSLLVAVCFNSVFGGISNFLLGPAMASLLANLERAAAVEQVNALHWCLVNFPAALVASACSLCYVAYEGVFSWRGEAISRAEEEARQKVAEKKKKHGRCSYADLLFFYIFSAFSIFYVVWAYTKVYTEYSALPALCATVVLLSALSGEEDQRFWGPGRRLLDWQSLSGHMSWTLLLVCGSTSLLSQMAVRHNLVKVVFDNVDTAFWKARSPITIQLLMAFTAAGFAELINSLALCDLIMPVVFEIASVSTTNPMLYAIPVAAAASSNLIFPSSIPLVILRNSLEMPTTEAVAVGLALKTVLVVSVVLSTNTVGRLLFRAEGAHQSVVPDVPRTTPNVSFAMLE